MDKKTARRKLLRRKYKRYAAAMAGAAIMAGVALPGIPAGHAMASEKPSTPSPFPFQLQQATAPDKDSTTNKPDRDWRDNDRDWRNHDRDDRDGWHQHRHSWPSSGDNQILYKDGRVYYRNDDSRYDMYGRYGYVHYLSSPVDYVKSLAANYGFDRYQDTFLLVSQTGDYAKVLVTKYTTGQRFIVELSHNYDNDWSIVSVNGLR